MAAKRRRNPPNTGYRRAHPGAYFPQSPGRDGQNYRWIIERDYQELKQELGPGHFEERNWCRFHHHATLCIAAYGFLVAERNAIFPSHRAGHLGFVASGAAPNFARAGRAFAPAA